MSPKFDVIVIGLGTAGSAAASVLAAAGKKVLALEAQNRVGGRVHTVPYANGVVELGAEWIHGTESSPIYDLALKHNIPLVSQEISYKIAHSKSQGKTPKREALIDELIGYGLQVWDNPPRNTESLGQNITKKINQYVKTNHPAIQNDTDFINNIIEFVELTVGNYEACYDWNNATTQTSYKSLEGDQHMSWHKNGYKTMFDILLNTYKNGSGHPSLEIKLNTEVTEIRSPQHPSEAVVVTTREGTTYTANAVIVTMSIGVLKERYKTLFSPQLPSDKVEAIEFLQIGLLDKVELHFAEPWWSYPGEMFNFFWDKKSRDSVSEEDTWITKIVFISNPMGSNKTMTVWFSGDQAKQMETLPDNIVKMKSMEVIRKFLGADRNIPDPIDILRTNWYSNPFTRGSYSYEHLATPSYPSARSDLALPIADSAGSPRLLFAGEATETKHFSTVHGAFESGIREAKRLLKTSFCASL